MRNVQTAAGGAHGALLALLLIHRGWSRVEDGMPACSVGTAGEVTAGHELVKEVLDLSESD